ncbi:hypothetical protein DPMN_157442 [Dreissena polymorpha]|uniref:Uncharacterized protein n=1 Tax=Dreissena polymorpha TaxID=45954 RepID=A0A9D4EK89_DREPO|nr:hypothetical protein DPMN_157383 [Dreissena polymorpha]KAH3779638.1 hypothetical protein DPMN_157442 [Dreissena polymorpha]
MQLSFQGEIHEDIRAAYEPFGQDVECEAEGSGLKWYYHYLTTGDSRRKSTARSSSSTMGSEEGKMGKI